MANTKSVKNFEYSNGFECDSQPVKGSEDFLLSGGVFNAMLPTTSIEKDDTYTLKADELTAVIAFEFSAGSKSLILGIEDGRSCIVANVGGTNAVTVKGLKDDTGTSIAAGKIALVIGSSTADATVITVLN